MVQTLFDLPGETIHLWYCSFGSNETHIPNYRSVLSDDELLKAEKFKFRIDRERHIISRGLLRTLLGRYLKKDPRNIRFNYTSYGKPQLPEHGTLHFNVSHSGDRAVFGFVRDSEVGVDVEKIKDDFDVLELASKFFSPLEVELLAKNPGAEMAKAFFRCWTRKESFIKAVGSGLSFPLDSFSVSMDDDLQVNLLETLWDASERHRWKMFSFVPSEGYIGAVAIRNRIDNISYMNLDDYPNL